MHVLSVTHIPQGLPTLNGSSAPLGIAVKVAMGTSMHRGAPGPGMGNPVFTQW